MDMKTPLERKLCELKVEKSEVDEKLNTLLLQREDVTMRLKETKRRLRHVDSQLGEIAKKQDKAIVQINYLNEDLVFRKCQAKELKVNILNGADKAGVCHSYLGQVTSRNGNEARIELKAIELEVDKVQKMLTSKRNDLFKIHNSLKNELEIGEQLKKAAESLEEEKSEIGEKIASMEMEERVLEGFVSRVKKNVKKARMKLPPVRISR